ncbi:helix-turn-helix transcriptional regulator [Seonamhaeicola maritimus]|uniref:Helix-turn-helix transcriptional regulator n=2 Tax=Seonamhaeicola maritimus TaxID=2591822 RepID=A0A5C7GNW3_9FLAO|nr:helix-turn-helix transcriptional regulator [Seonamhaeicola maritimus]
MDSEYKKEDFLLLFGSRIDIIRRKKGYSYERIAQGCNIDGSDISKISKGRVNITLSSILELSKGLDIHPKELFDFEIEA